MTNGINIGISSCQSPASGEHAIKKSTVDILHYVCGLALHYKHDMNKYVHTLYWVCITYYCILCALVHKLKPRRELHIFLYIMFCGVLLRICRIIMISRADFFFVGKENVRFGIISDFKNLRSAVC